MPNGGSDCCGTCWFNRRNKGVDGYPDPYEENPEAPYCEIRNEPIANPFYTYCANHPKRRPDRDPIPLGPIYVASEQDEMVRVVAKPSPDTEEIRQHLLDRLSVFEMVAATDNSPKFQQTIFTFLVDAHIVMWQLGEFRENRAAEMLQRLSDTLPENLTSVAKDTLAKVRDGDK